MKKITFAIIPLISLLLTAACHNAKKITGDKGNTAALAGTWELNYITGPRITFEGLYPNKKPEISFRLTDNELGGNTSCNGFSSKITLDGNSITVNEPFAKTMMFCEGGGEETFLRMLVKVNKYAVEGDILTFLIGDVPAMRFAKKAIQ